MNERIQKLMWDAGLNSNYVEGFDSIYSEQLEKFAELIVRECINQVLEEKVSEDWIDKEDDIEDRCYLRGNNGGIVDAVIRIKQHFGVEE